MNDLICPVSDKMMNENAGRMTAAVIFIIVTLFLITQNIWFLAFALFDFSFRVFEKVNFSPVSWLVKTFWKYFNLPVKTVNKAPKVFAARLGFFLTALSLFLFLFFPLTASIIAGILAICIFADAAFNFCIGCIIYHYIVYPFYKENNG